MSYRKTRGVYTRRPGLVQIHPDQPPIRFRTWISSKYAVHLLLFCARYSIFVIGICCLFGFHVCCVLREQQVPVSSDVAVVYPTVEPPPPYTPASSWEANAATASANEELRRRQEELERKAAELQRREDEIQRNMQYQGLLICRLFMLTIFDNRCLGPLAQYCTLHD